MPRDVSIAVVGATGAVGLEFLKVLEQRAFPVSSVRLFASPRSVGKQLAVNGKPVSVEQTHPGCFNGVDFAFISVSSELSEELAPQAVEAGALVIDDSSAFRMRPEVPLVVPEINGQDMEEHRGIISIPNCSTTQMVMAIAPLHAVNPVRRIVVDSYQSVSGAGSGAMEELRSQANATLTGEDDILSSRIAFNLRPQIGDFLSSGYTKEEEKMSEETRKIMHAPDMAVSATCVRVPVLVCHSEAVHIESEGPWSVTDARNLLANFPGVSIIDNPQAGEYPMPWDLAGTDDVYVGRIRQDWSHPNGLAMWVVADNLRKGAALNAIQIAEEVLRRDCLKPTSSLSQASSA